MGYQPSLLKYIEGQNYIDMQKAMHRVLAERGLDEIPWSISRLHGVSLEPWAIRGRPQSVQHQIITMGVGRLMEMQVITKVGRLYQWTDTIVEGIEPKLEGKPIDPDLIPLMDVAADDQTK